MKPFISFALCLSVALVGNSVPSFAQYGKATQQSVTTAAPQTAQDENEGIRRYDKNAKTIKPTNTAVAPAPDVVKVKSSFVMPKGANVAVFYDDFSIRKTLGGQIFCQMTFYVENNTKMNLDALSLRMKWPGISTSLSIDNVPADDLKTERYALVGKGCYTMGDTPTIEVSKCIMREFTKDGRVIDVPEEQCKGIVTFK